MAPIRLTALPTTIKNLTGEVVPHHRCYRAALDGRLPGARRSDTGRWSIDADQLPKIVEFFGLKPLAAPQQGGK